MNLLERTFYLLGRETGDPVEQLVEPTVMDQLLVSCVRTRRALARLDDHGGAEVLRRMLRVCEIHSDDLSLEALKRAAQNSGVADAVLWQAIMWQPGEWDGEWDKWEDFVFRNLLGPSWLARLYRNGYEVPSRYENCLRSMAAQLVRLLERASLDVCELQREAKQAHRSSLALVRDAISRSRHESRDAEWVSLCPSILALLDRKEMVALGCVLVPLQRMRMRTGAPRALPAVESGRSSVEDEVKCVSTLDLSA